MPGENQINRFAFLAVKADVDVGMVLRAMRQSAGLTQLQLARHLSVSITWIRLCERDEHSIEVIEFILWCRACSLEPAEAVEWLIAPERQTDKLVRKGASASLQARRASQLKNVKSALR